MELTKSFRPKNFDEFVGQKELLSDDGILRKLVASNNFKHSLFYGPAGVGKTSLARVIANELGYDFYEFNATSLKIDELRKVFNSYKNSLVKPLIFIDEIHRLLKNQQEVLLPVMEENTALILGASTQNPYYTLTSAIRSRSLLFELKPIPKDELKKLLQKVKNKYNFEIENDAQEYLVNSSGGDARAMLILLESALSIEKNITLKTLKQLRANPLQSGANEANTHYDLISAFIKSIRGSDADAAVYYLSAMIENGESADFIARRLVILASEDIGNANPNALNIATSTLTAVKEIGFPEARIILSQCVIYLATSPKSNSSYEAINKAQKYIKQNGYTVPENIKHNPKDYLYPHDFGGYVKQNYLNEDIKFVEFKNSGYEKKLKEWQEEIKRRINS